MPGSQLQRIRPLRTEDFPAVLRLTDEEEWGITPKVLRRILSLDPTGSFVASERNHPVATLTTTTYQGKLAWIGNVVVDKKKRGTGLGKAMVQHAIKYLRRRRIRKIALYCYRQHVEFYEKLGFVRSGAFELLSAKHRSRIRELQRRHVPRAVDWNAVSRLDTKFFGADRLKLLKLAAKDNPGSLTVARENGHLVGFVSRDESPAGAQIGPLICKPARVNVATELAASALASCRTFPADVGVPAGNPKALSLFRNLGFSRIRQGHRMFLGTASRLGDSSGVFAIGFLDKG